MSDMIGSGNGRVADSETLAKLRVKTAKSGDQRARQRLTTGARGLHTGRGINRLAIRHPDPRPLKGQPWCDAVEFIGSQHDARHDRYAGSQRHRTAPLLDCATADRGTCPMSYAPLRADPHHSALTGAIDGHADR